MKHSLIFIIPGKPESKGRPRFTRKNGYVRTYTPDKTHDYESLVRYYALKARQDSQITEPIAENMAISIKAYFGVPKSFSKKRRELCIKGEERPAKKPDSDNIAKIILDGLNPKMKLNKALHKSICVQEGLYCDDKQVVSLKVEKWYAKEPRVEITARWKD